MMRMTQPSAIMHSDFNSGSERVTIMAKKRFLLEMGMGVDLHDKDYTKAAVRAVREAIWHNSFGAAARMRPKSSAKGSLIAVAFRRLPCEVKRRGTWQGFPRVRVESCLQSSSCIRIYFPGSR